MAGGWRCDHLTTWRDAELVGNWLGGCLWWHLSFPTSLSSDKGPFTVWRPGEQDKHVTIKTDGVAMASCFDSSSEAVNVACNDVSPQPVYLELAEIFAAEHMS
ncbi:hypothetical protein E4U51_000806 [Claviceps purpurea]|nr:hypothetical protein E4U51_000806 [Claviceps purpurea]